MVDTQQPTKFDLGPRWSSEEIHVFFESKILLSYNGLVFKKCGKDWQAIVDELHLQGFTHRTKEHIKSLYFKVTSLLHTLVNKI